MAADPEIPFTAEERLMYAVLRSNPGALKAHTNRMAASIEWAREEFFGCSIAVLRSPLPLRSTTSPVLSIRAPDHPALSLPLPGQTPYSFVLSLDPHTLALLTLGDFDGAFVNERMDAASALGFNRQYAGQFAYFAAIRHLITDRDGLADDMTWAPYRFVSEDDRKVVFRRKV